MSSPASTTKTGVLPPSTRKRRRRLRFRVVLGGLAAAVLFCVLTPPVFRACVRGGLILLAHEKGVDLAIGEVKGSIFEPVSFYFVKLEAFSPARTLTNLEIARADVDVSLAKLVFKRGAGCVRSVSVDGLEGVVKFQPENTPSGDRADAPLGKLWPVKLIPGRVDAVHVNVTFKQGRDSVQLQNLHGSASDVESGIIGIDKVVVHQPWLNKTFTLVRGTTALQNSRFSIANLSLQKDVSITSASSDLIEMANRRLKIEFQIAAFDGTIRGDIKGRPGDLHSMLEANGSFSQISVAPLAAFLDFHGEAGGVIKEGKFTFRGTLRNLEKATLSVLLEATDFRLGKRQWNSLVGGATLVENRIRINELHLKQAHNELDLKGSMAFPAPNVEWWQSEFAFDLSAKIDNLTELSNLFGPNFADMGGKMSVDGSIRGSNQSFSGDLTVAGSNLSYRGAPFDSLSASVHLNGNELQVANLDLSSKNDYVRGKGVVNILGKDKRYWGNLKASVADLSRYSAILQKPIVPQPVTGGLMVDWSGDGVATAHSGAFHAQLKKFRLASVTEPKANPLDADLEATYSPGNIFFSKFVLWDADTKFSAKVTAAPKTLNLQSLHMQQNNEVWLEGDALLPFNVWSAWGNASWDTLLEFDSPCKINVEANGLDLHQAALLSGRQLPIKGMLDMKLTADGTLNDLKAKGRVQLKKAQVVLGETEPDTIGADADVTFNEQEMRIEKSQVRFNAREFGINGDVNLKNLRNPDFDVVFRSRKISFPLRADAKADADVDLDVRGTCGESLVSGTAHLLDFKTDGKLNAGTLLRGETDLKIKPVLPFDASKPPMDKWQFDVDVVAAEPVKIISGGDESGSLAADFTARGKGNAIRLSGVAKIQGVPIVPEATPATGNGDSPVNHAENPKPTMITNGVVMYPADDSPAWFVLAVAGKAPGANPSGWIYGRENEKSSIYYSDAIPSQQQLLDLFMNGNAGQEHTQPGFDKGGDVPLNLIAAPSQVEGAIDPGTK